MGVGLLGMCRWTGCLFELPALEQGVFFGLPELVQGAFLSTRFGMFLLISQAIFSRIPTLLPSLTADTFNFSEQNIKELENTIKTKSKLILITP